MKKIMVIAAMLIQGVVFSQNYEKYSVEEISNYFKLAKSLADKDDGMLWGINLYGPIMLVDPETKQIYTNWPDKNNQLKAISNDVFVGKLAEDELFANTATTWNGVYWTQVMLSALDRGSSDNGELLMHECWHRIQDSIGFSGTGSNNAHLDKLYGRIYLQLEWKALYGAFIDKANKLFHLENALLFRNYRRTLYEGAAENENRFEMNEGLANYTGYCLSDMQLDTIINRLFSKIKQTVPTRKYSLSYAYINGLAYGMHLRQFNKNWNKLITKESDLGMELQREAGIKHSEISVKTVQERLKYYDGEKVIKDETEYEQIINEKTEFYTKQFITGDILELPALSINISFNPYLIFNLNAKSKVYEILRVKADWGYLDSTKGALLMNDWTKIVLSKPLTINTLQISGEGWELKLNNGWKIAELPGKAGSFTIIRMN